MEVVVVVVIVVVAVNIEAVQVVGSVQDAEEARVLVEEQVPVQPEVEGAVVAMLEGEQTGKTLSIFLSNTTNSL